MGPPDRCQHAAHVINELILTAQVGPALRSGTSRAAAAGATGGSGAAPGAAPLPAPVPVAAGHRCNWCGLACPPLGRTEGIGGW